MLHSPLASERIQRIDPHTGIKVIQITSYPTPSEPMSYDWPSFTPDGKRLLLRCDRTAARRSTQDLFRYDVDGLNLFQLTERPAELGVPRAVLSLDGTCVYCVWRDEGILWEIDFEDGTMREMFSFSECFPNTTGTIVTTLACANRYVFSTVLNGTDGEKHLIRTDLSTGEQADLGADLSVYGYDYRRDRLILRRYERRLGVADTGGQRAIVNLRDRPQELYSTDLDGKDERFICTLDLFAHSAMLGQAGVVQGTGKPPDRCIWIAEDGAEPYKLVEGPYFWHSGGSFDGEWIVADTNWPNAGIHLIHVPTRRYALLCHDGATCGQPNFSHPHPALSHDGRYAVFGSDQTGIQQVYVAHITDEFRERIIGGDTLETRISF